MDDQEKRAGLLSGGQVTRREVLKKGLIGAAGLTVLPTVIAACGGSTATASPSIAPVTPPPSGATPPPVTPPPVTPTPGPSGPVSFGSNYSDAVPKKALADMVAAFSAAMPAVQVKINTQDHQTYQNQITSYLGAKPDDVICWFAGFRMRFFTAQGLMTPIDDVWATLNQAPGFKASSTGDDGKLYLVPLANYPWALFYRPSLWTAKGYTVPATMADFKTLCAKMKADGIVPIAFADKEAWPGMGTFDILNLRQNGYQFHVDLLAGKNKWTDPKVLDTFNLWKDLMPYHQSGAAGRLWQDGAQALIKKTAGMYFMGMFVSEQFAAVDAATLADLDFFPWPYLGNSFDAEKALDAPIDGFMIAAKSAAGIAGPEQDAAKAFIHFLGTGAAQDIYVKVNPGVIAAAGDADTSAYGPLQKKAVELIGAAQKITQFLDRDTNPGFTAPNGVGNFILKFIGDPAQDLNALLTQIQAFWDTLPPAS
jgi:multiple sugar transport system substrate-binding protein